MSTFNTPWFNNQDPNFFNTLNKSKTPHLVLAAETEDFDEVTVQQWVDEGFDVRYVPLLGGGESFVDRVHSAGDEFGTSEQYAIIAFGPAASLILEAHTRPRTPRLVAIIAYYPTTIPSIHTRFPPSLRVLVHLAGTDIAVARTPAVLGVQGRRTHVRKRIDAGPGFGERLSLPGHFRAYTYSAAEPGFAETDLEEYDAVAERLAFGRSLEVVKRGFRMMEEGGDREVERLCDRFNGFITAGTTRTTRTTTTAAAAEKEEEEAKGRVAKAMDMMRADAHVLFAPTLCGGIGEEDLKDFYAEFFTWPADAQVKLLSRTVGVDRLVDELFVSFTHTEEIPWMLPAVRPTQKKIEIAMVAILHVRGAKLESEHVYWDQASVLVQVGLLDPSLVPHAFKRQGIKGLPVVGAESARAMKRGSSKHVNSMIPDW